MMKKKLQLQTIREEAMKGNYICSRVQWLNDQEKPSRYFCSLEHRNYIEKTAKKVKMRDGLICTDPKCILLEFKNFYSKLFKADSTDDLEGKNLENMLSKKT